MVRNSCTNTEAYLPPHHQMVEQKGINLEEELHHPVSSIQIESSPIHWNVCWGCLHSSSHNRMLYINGTLNTKKVTGIL